VRECRAGSPPAWMLGDRYRRDRFVLGLFVAMAAAVGLAALAAFVEPPVLAVYALAAMHGRRRR
jgi:hypothetical protein